MRRVRQIWGLWSEELKPKWSAFTPTGWFKRIICHDWSNFAPPFLLLVREWQLKAEAQWRKGIRRHRRDRGLMQNMLLSSRTAWWTLVKDDAVWTDTVSDPARGDRSVATVREHLISNIFQGKVWKLQMSILEVSHAQMAFVLLFLPLSFSNSTQLWFS